MDPTVSIDLGRLDVRQLAFFGDAAIRAGDRPLAHKFYKALMERASRQAHVVTRAGLPFASQKLSVEILDLVEHMEVKQRQVFASQGLITWLKTLPFADDARFMELADRYAPLLPIPNWHWNLQTVAWAVEQIRSLEGDLVELGVFRGHTTLFVAEYLDFHEWPRRWWLYDTFDGIPEDQLDPGWAESNASAYRGTFSYEEVAKRFSHIPNIDVIKGRVPEILSERCPERISFIHMDLNNAAAEVQALDFLFDRLVPGGIIVFDDYCWLVSRAQFDAERAWFKARGLSILPIPTGQGVFVKR